ncbi:MAG: inorganic diphosphatase, partial [Chitinophagaceae bacterium]
MATAYTYKKKAGAKNKTNIQNMDLVTMVIETPRYSAGKYIFDKRENCFRLKKVLKLGMTFPYDFGMVKNTLGEDGGPVDAMVFTESTTYPGVELKCRVIEALLARQTSPAKKKSGMTDIFLFRNIQRYMNILKQSEIFPKSITGDWPIFSLIIIKLITKKLSPLNMCLQLKLTNFWGNY